MFAYVETMQKGKVDLRNFLWNKKTLKPFDLSVFPGGEGEIRTLEPFYRLHDFQSCALDQLGDFSKAIRLLPSRLTA